MTRHFPRLHGVAGDGEAMHSLGMNDWRSQGVTRYQVTQLRNIKFVFMYCYFMGGMPLDVLTSRILVATILWVIRAKVVLEKGVFGRHFLPYLTSILTEWRFSHRKGSLEPWSRGWTPPGRLLTTGQWCMLMPWSRFLFYYFPLLFHLFLLYTNAHCIFNPRAMNTVTCLS